MLRPCLDPHQPTEEEVVARASMQVFRKGNEEFVYSYATTSVDRIPELQGYIDRLDGDGQLSDHEVFRSYIQDARYALPEDFPNPRSIVALALDTKLMKVMFDRNGQTCDVLVPPQYYRTGMTPETLEEIVQTDIIGTEGHSVARLRHGHMKLLAVRTGLGRYGRNNICCVDGMGTLLTLYAFVTDFEFKSDEWTNVGVMDVCKNCRICRESCPTGAIREESFVIDVGKCTTLYNEIEGDFPEWLPNGVHNALVGCMRCQLPCPGNRQPLERRRTAARHQRRRDGSHPLRCTRRGSAQVGDGEAQDRRHER